MDCLKRTTACPSLDSKDLFRAEIEGYGLCPSVIIADGTIHRCGTSGRERGKDGAYLLHPDPPVSGWWKNYRTGQEDTWTVRHGQDMTPQDRAMLKLRIEATKKVRQEEQARRHADAAAIAAKITKDALACPDAHPYLKAKGVSAHHGLMLAKDGCVIIPVFDSENNLMSLQFIERDGSKRFLSGGRTKNGYFPIKGSDGPLVVAEGYATAATIHRATGATVLVAFYARNLRAVAEMARMKYPNRSIVLAADNDRLTDGNPGVANATEAAQAVKGQIVVPKFPAESKGTDFNDLANEVGMDVVLRQLSRVTVCPAQASFRLLNLGELLAVPRPTEWLLKGYLEAQSLACLFGVSGSMKTFLAIDMGLTIASGISWHGVSTPHPGPVIYIAGEGQRGLSRRVKAWLEAHEMRPGDVPFFVASTGIQVRDPESMAETISAIKTLCSQYGNPSLIILDTLARSFGPGDENSTADMSGFVASLDSLREDFGCAVLVVHHTGLSERERARGAYAFTAALDWSYRLDICGDTRVLTCTKSKDFEPPDDLVFEPVSTAIGWADSDTGAIISSVTLREVGGAELQKISLSAAQRKALDALQGSCDLGGRTHLDSWRMAAYQNDISSSRRPDARRKAFNRAVKALIESGHVETKDGYYWLAGTGTNPDMSRTSHEVTGGTDTDIPL